MKKFFFLICLCLLASPANSAPAVESASPASSAPLEAPPLPASMLRVPDFLGEDTVPLTKRERAALKLARDWAGRGPAPVLSQSGKLVYVHGASMPTILANPMQVCDVELQPGEKVNEIVVGDSARWMVETGTAGSTTHLFVKPIDAGLETSAVITTNRRVYHLRLLSRRSGHTPYVGFLYADAMKSRLMEQQTAENQEKERTTAVIDGQSIDLSSLNFEYEVKGTASWKPERVFDDTEKTYIHLPRKKLTEIPVALARRAGENVLVNYRVKDHILIVDGIYDDILLLLGVGSQKEDVQIVRKGK